MIFKIGRTGILAAALVASASGLLGIVSAITPTPKAEAKGPAVEFSPGPRIVAMRRLTEAQYRNSIADIFGPDVTPKGRFEPITRVQHELIASGASGAAISPTGLEQFDVMARGVAAQVFDARHRVNFVRCTPKNEAAADNRCADEVLNNIGRYVLRRPLTSAERSEYAVMAAKGAERTGSFYEGLELALAAMLVSPEFLYIIETAEPDPEHPGDLRLDNYSRAARLSYLLWNTTPDRALLDAAAAGRLTDPAQLRAIAERMVSSPRLEEGVRAFFGDMLMFEKFEGLAKDSVIYPRFNPDVARDMPEQMLRTIIDHLVTRKGDYRELFTTRHTFVSRSLGPLYFVPVKRREGWERYTFAEGDDRAGLLGQAGFLALYAHSGRSSSTLRGKAVRELLLCQPVPPPPGNVNFTVVQDTNNTLLRTARERLSAHATDPSCSGCHMITDPIGLPLEGFDGIGAARREENGKLIDLSGTLGDVNFKGATGLGRALAADPALTECAALRMLEYATGRPTDEEAAKVEALLSSFAASQYRLPELMLAVAIMPEAYQVSAAKLSPPLNLTQSFNPITTGASR